MHCLVLPGSFQNRPVMNILNKIVTHKSREIREKKSLYPCKFLEKSILFKTAPVSFGENVLREDKSGIIAEFKTCSPSRGEINPYADVKSVTVGYMKAGASALSVLTDNRFFGGSFENFLKARKHNNCPILQKDFIIDEYQVVEAKSSGADAILLIAAILDKQRVMKLARTAAGFGMEVLLEIHSYEELDMLNEYIQMVGVNNRDLRTFNTDISFSIGLADKLPEHVIRISESGIYSVEDIIQLKRSGYNGFLIGEKFMQTTDPGKACREFIKLLYSSGKKFKENN